MRFFAKLLILGLLASPLTPTACVTETEIESEPGEATEVDQDLEPDMDALDAEIDSVGAAIEEGAEAVGDAAADAEDAVDENIDLGDNAGTPEVDDDN